MTDRITQLQECISQQAENFCNSIGILQQDVPLGPGYDSESQSAHQQEVQEDYVNYFTTIIMKCAKDMDSLIESMPSEESTPELQAASLKRLETENQEAGEKLKKVVQRGEELLERIQAALSYITQAQLDIQRLTKDI